MRVRWAKTMNAVIYLLNLIIITIFIFMSTNDRVKMRAEFDTIDEAR